MIFSVESFDLSKKVEPPAALIYTRQDLIGSFGSKNTDGWSAVYHTNHVHSAEIGGWI